MNSSMLREITSFSHSHPEHLGEKAIEDMRSVKSFLDNPAAIKLDQRVQFIQNLIGKVEETKLNFGRVYSDEYFSGRMNQSACKLARMFMTYSDRILGDLDGAKQEALVEINARNDEATNAVEEDSVARFEEMKGLFAEAIKLNGELMQGYRIISNLQSRDDKSDGKKETLISEGRKEKLTREEGRETLTSEKGKETLTREEGRETLTSEEGKETLTSEEGKETLTSEERKEIIKNIIISDLNSYIEEVESHKKNGKVDFQYDFDVFVKSRGQSREANYELAKILKAQLVQNIPIDRVFNIDYIDVARRHKIADIRSDGRNDFRPGNVISSGSSLDRIIKKARSLLEEAVPAPVISEHAVEKITPKTSL